MGTSVTLTGSNLTGTSGVSFNGTAATTFAVVNATTVTATVPTGATTGNVTLTTPNGTSSGVAFTVNPPTNNALAFDGVGAYVHVSTALPATSLFTLEGWVNPTSLNNGFNVLLNGDNFPTGTVHCQFLNNGQLRFTISGMTDMDSPFTVPLGRWSHVAVVYSATSQTLQFYLNGTLTGGTLSYPGGIAVASQTYSLGAWLSGSPQRFFTGRYDEVRVYSAALTAANIQADMFSTNASVPGSQVAYYNFDQGTAGGNNAGFTSLPDQTSNGHTGTLTNFALTGTTSNWVRSFPTITGISPTSGKSGTGVTVTGTNLTDATSFAFNGTAVTPFTTPGSDLTAVLTAPQYVTTGPVSLASATLTAYTGPVFTLVNDLVVTTTQSIPADSYSSLTVQSGGNGTLAGDVMVSGPIVVNSGGRLADGCNLFTGSGSFTLNAGGTLDICRPRGILSGPGTALGNIGAVRVLGARTYSSDASYSYSGGQSQDTGDGLPGQVRNFLVATSTDLSLTNPLAVTQVLTLSGAGNLTTGGKALTLLSSSAGTALVVNSGTGVINGATTAQRYIDGSLNAGLGYRHFGAPVSGATVASLGTATSGFTPVLTPAYNTSATPGTTTPFPNVFAYDETRLATTTNNLSAFDKGFVVPAATTTTLANGQGYAVNIAAGQTVSFTGTAFTGDLTKSLSRGTDANAGWALLANPYPAPLDYSLVANADRSNLDAAVYVVQSSGQYMGSYRSYVNGIGGNPVLPTAQGFFVRVSAGQTSGSLTFHNAQRLTAVNATAFQRTTADLRPQVQLDLAGNGLADAFTAYAQDGATAGFDTRYDAVKLPNSTGLNLASATATDNLAIDGRPAFTAGLVLPLAVGVPAAGTYSLSATTMANLPAGLAGFLTDAQTGQTTQLSPGTSYRFSVTAAQATSLLTGRFSLRFGPQTALATVPVLTAELVSVYPNPAHGSFAVLVPGVAQATSVQAELLNTLGQAVRRQSAALPAAGTTLTVETANLAAGVYTLRLTAGATVLAKRVVIQ